MGVTMSPELLIAIAMLCGVEIGQPYHSVAMELRECKQKVLSCYREYSKSGDDEKAKGLVVVDCFIGTKAKKK